MYSIKAENQRTLTKDQLTSIFKRTANNTRLMSKPQFLESLDKIAEGLYSPELDKNLNTAYAYLSVNEKRELLYKLLEIHNFSLYHHKKKAFGAGFSPEKYSRIPLSESSHQYKFKLNDSSQKKLEIWKKTKARLTPPLLNPIPENMKSNSSLVRKSIKALPASGYALRLKAKKEKVEQKTEELLKINESDNEKEEKIVEPKNKFITIKALNDLDYNDIDDEFGVKDLITDESDDFFDKLYGIEPKLQGIMKMHDEKLAKGQRVVEKNKYAYKNS